MFKLSYSLILLAAMLLLFTQVTVAQDSTITTRTTWTGNQTLNTNVVVESGGVLVLSAGTTLNFLYADINNDNIGDFKITVKNGGRLVVQGTNFTPVTIQGSGFVPPANAKKHWSGIIFENTSTPTDTIKFLKVYDANVGITLGRTINTPGLTIADCATTGMEVTASGVTISGLTITGSGKGVVLGGANATLSYVTLSSITGNGIEVNAAGATINWATVSTSGTGIYVGAGGTSTTITNADVDSSTKSGLFNLDGTVTITNSNFKANAFHGIVNSSGILTATNVEMSNNTGRGLLIGGASTTTVVASTDTNNTSYGVDVTTAKILTDVLTPTGTAETPTPVVYFNNSNIFSNNGSGTEVNIGAALNPMADFTANWWNADDNIASLITAPAPVGGSAGNITYVNWRTAALGGRFSTAVANLTPTKAITINYPVAAQSVISGETLVVTWTTTGNIPYVVVSGTEIAANDSVPNTGSYTITNGAVGAKNVTVTEYSSGNTSSGAKAYTVTAAAVAVVNAPATASTIFGLTQDAIRWVAPSTWTTVKIEYTTNTGGTWTEIVNGIPASQGYYVWTVPNIQVTGATQAVRISNETNLAQNASSGTFSIRPMAPASWAYTITDNNMTVNFTDISIVADDGTTDIISADEDIFIGAFYTDGLASKCAGYTVLRDYDGAALTAPGMSLTVYGDNPFTTEVDGVPAGTTSIIFKVYRLSWLALDPSNDSPAGDPNDRQGNAQSNATTLQVVPYSVNGIVTRALFEYQRGAAVTAGPTRRIITLTAEWMMIASNVSLVDDDLSYAAVVSTDLFSPASALTGLTAYPATAQGWDFNMTPANFTMLKDGLGQVYWKVSGTDIIDQLTNTFDYRKGYFLKMSAVTGAGTDSLLLYGTPVNANLTPLSLSAGWNLIPYLDSTATNIGTALSSISPQLQVVKNSAGQVYWPSQSINTIGTMQPLNSYLVSMSDAGTLTYPALSSSKVEAGPDYKYKAPEHYVVAVNSDNSSVVAISEVAIAKVATAGDEIGVFGNGGVLVGSATYMGGNTAVTIWGRSSDENDTRGLAEGEAFTFRLWDKESGKEIFLQSPILRTGSSTFEKDGVTLVQGFSKIEGSVPTEFALEQNYPNPFNPSTIIKFALPSDSKVSLRVYNVLGEVVSELLNDKLAAGYHEVKFDATGFSSGIYFYRIEAGNFVEVRKMNLMK